MTNRPHCKFHVNIALVAAEHKIPKFPGDSYFHEQKTRIELHCPIPGCHVVAVLPGKPEHRVCTRCGVRLNENCVSDRRCWKCRKRTENLFS